MKLKPTVACVGQVLDRERGVLPGHLRRREGLVGVRDVVGEGFPRTLQTLPERDERVAVPEANALAPEGELARTDPDREALLRFGVELSEAMHDDGTVLAESVADIAGERERQPRIDEGGHTDAADSVGHGDCVRRLRSVGVAVRRSARGR